MSNKIEVDLLSKEIMKSLIGYADDITEVVEEDANEIGKKATTELKRVSPVGARKKYSKGWRLKKQKIGKNKYVIKIHNKTDYQLTHLLEFGHATRNGGRTNPQPHIRPIEKKYREKFEKKLKQDIGGLK